MSIHNFNQFPDIHHSPALLCPWLMQICSAKRMQELLRIVDEAWNSGIVVVCAAGMSSVAAVIIGALFPIKEITKCIHPVRKVRVISYPCIYGA